MDTATVVIMVDGLDPEYLDACPTPRLTEIAKEGFRVNARAMMPTVTNVNNVSLITGAYPESHGITSNYWWDREQNAELYMESGDYVRSESMFQRATAIGARSLLVTSKDKLRSLLSNGTTVNVSAEQPPEWVVKGVGEPPPVYSLEVNQWVVDAGRYILSQQDFDLVYLTTTDYAMHTYPPEHPESARHLALLDAAIGRLFDSMPRSRIVVTADHGMSSKTRMLHLPERLDRAGIKARAVPVIKDRYTVHHSNLGGCIYLHLDEQHVPTAVEVLRNTDGVDEALPREEAARRFKLEPERIGDIMVLGGADVVFGDSAEVEMPATLCSHGSAHEIDIPIIGCGPGLNGSDGSKFKENREIGLYVLDEVLV